MPPDDVKGWIRDQDRIYRCLGIAHPICSAGMARVAQADLVVAVSNAGGFEAAWVA